MALYKTPEYHPAFEEYCEAIFELREDEVAVIQADLRVGKARTTLIGLPFVVAFLAGAFLADFGDAAVMTGPSHEPGRGGSSASGDR